MRERSRREKRPSDAGQEAGRRYKTSAPGSPPKRAGRPHQKAARSEHLSEAHSEPSLALAPRAVGSLFRTARESLHLTQEQLAALVSERPWQVSRAEIGAIERGRHLPGLVTLIGLSQALHLDPIEAIERVKTASQAPIDLTGLSHGDLDRRASDLFWAGDYREALACYDAMLERLVLDPPTQPGERRRLEGEVNLRRAATMRRLGAYKAARTTVERAIAVSESWPEIQANAYCVLATLHAQSGNPPLAHDAAERATALAKKCGAEVESRALCAKGRILFQAGRFEQAHESYSQARGAARKCGDEIQLVHIEGDIGLCLQALGRPKLARTWMMRALDLSRKRKLPLPEATLLVNLGWLALEEKSLDEANRFTDGALRIARTRDDYITIFRAEWLRHKILRQQDHHAPDRNRLALLKKLIMRIGTLSGEHEIDAFKVEVLGTPEPEGRTEP